ncbi:uncharacterized protein LOC124533088 [Vanessa cardui]|uniref:uncharacterized protein LOC124533088 n=1 Tax=Vanessa cardui TaxID=171605 RepID=UPI001F12CF36|nr:uncharacterized protein LOC124533088 [Vanessa cardui]
MDELKWETLSSSDEELYTSDKSSATLRKKISDGIKFLELRPVKFTVWRLFAVNSSLLLTILSVFISYTIVLLQFIQLSSTAEMDRGAMGLLLKISRPVGIAPVKYAPEFQVSRPLGLVADNFIKICAVTVLSLVAVIGVFTAPARMTSMDNYFKRLNQMQRTQDLIISGKSKENEREVEHELELFSRILILSNVFISYSPLSMFTIDRPLMVKMFGGLTTYLVIILQYGDQKEHLSHVYNNVTGGM